MAQSGLLDFLQAASNEAAGTVAAPVDLLAWLARKAGVPVGDAPVGGSEWQKRKGLMVDVPQSAASLAGSTVGLLSPVAAAAKAPQIAKGLLQAGDNLAAPRTLNPQTGAIVWHGSPHKFDKFDASKIGTGEGAQAYGHGLYLADSPDVARGYQTKLAPDKQATSLNDRIKSLVVGDKPVTDYGIEMNADFIDAARKGPKEALAHIDERLASWKKNAADPAYPFKDYAAEKVAGFEALRKDAAKKGVEYVGDGALYKVDLPDEKIARMLDWDAPLSQQAPEIQKFFEPYVAQIRKVEAGTSGPEWGALAAPRTYDPTGGELVRLLAGRKDNLDASTILSGGTGGAATSKAIRDAGIPGIRYLDGGSRGAGAGTRNYVIFPGNEGLLNILERNGQPLLGP